MNRCLKWGLAASICCLVNAPVLHSAWGQEPVPTPEIDLDPLIADLDSPEFRVRQEAERQLRDLPAQRLPELEARIDPDNPEQRNRVLRVANYIKDHGPQGVRTLTAKALDPELSSDKRNKAFRKLAKLICDGDTTAIKALSNLSTRTQNRGNNGDAARMRMEQMNNMRDAFKVLGNAASEDNHHAITALVVAAKVPTLRSYAPQALGQAAAKGSEKALEILTHPVKFGLNASSTILALQPAISQENPAAIKALQAMLEKPGNGGLHYIIATALQAAAAQNNPSAVDALGYIVENNTSSSTLKRALDGLKLASQKGNEKAATLVETWQPKLDAQLKNRGQVNGRGVRVVPNGQGRIRIAPNIRIAPKAPIVPKVPIAPKK
jgi:HEAT repeat protein